MTTQVRPDIVRPDQRSGPEFYERIYVDAGDDAGALPWTDGDAHPALVRWLDVVAARLVRCGGRVVVPACGHGAEVREVAHRGYDVIGFDAAPAAIALARRVDPEQSSLFVEADLFAVPPRWRHRFDLVVEVNTLQALAPETRPAMLTAMADLLAPHGHLLAIGRAVPPPAEGATPAAPAPAPADPPAESGPTPSTAAEDRTGPPWPIEPGELVERAAEAGLTSDGAVHRFEDDRRPGRWVFRGLFRRTP